MLVKYLPPWLHVSSPAAPGRTGPASNTCQTCARASPCRVAEAAPVDDDTVAGAVGVLRGRKWVGGVGRRAGARGRAWSVVWCASEGKGRGDGGRDTAAEPNQVHAPDPMDVRH